MQPLSRARKHAPAILLAGLILALGACVGGDYPNSTFNHHTDLNTATDALWDSLLFWGTAVFVFVEAILVFTIIKFRKREGAPEPKHVHGNTALELTWTIVPLLILVVIAVPTVRTIFKTQAAAPEGSLEIEVIGHQWWWEYRYPQYGFTTANEMYVQNGRPVNLSLRTIDVLHSFWVPQLGGKRDLITNKTNHLWFTPNADLETAVWNGFCTEYCGTSHANMRIRAYTVSQTEFDAWVRGQQAPPAFTVTASGTSGTSGTGNTLSAAGGDVATQDAQASTWFFPAERLPEYAKPKTPLPSDIAFDDALLAQGDAARGLALVNVKGACLACHIHTTSTPPPYPVAAPNLTHLATRHTFAGGLFPNEPRYLARWVKNAPRMKPGARMNALGLGEYDAFGKSFPTIMGKLTDQEIADIVAYLRALK
jgi:cytochrome c oxidase subunit 2